MDHDEIKSLIPAYALGAVPEDELRRIRDHILSCEECMAEADSYARVTGSLALSAQPVRLPEGFEGRVLAAVREDGIEVGRRVPSRRRWPLAWAFAGVAAAIALVLAGAALVDAQRDSALKDRVITALLQSEGTGIELSGNGAGGRVIPREDGSLFVATGLTSAPEGRTYQLWLMRGRGCPTGTGCEVVSAGTFDFEDGLVYLELGRSVFGWDHSAVTIEPAGGSPGPTTQPIISSFAASAAE